MSARVTRMPVLNPKHAGPLVKALGLGYRRSVTHKYIGRRAEFISPQRHRELDAEMLVDRLPHELLDRLRLMDDEDIALLTIVATGVFFCRE